MKVWPVFGISVVQASLLVAHWFLYYTWIAFFDPASATAVFALRMGCVALGFSFVVASLLSFRFSNPVVAVVYRLAAVWLGFLSYFFWAAIGSWLVWFALMILRVSVNPAVLRPWIAGVLALAALLAGVYGLVNARRIRVRRIAVELPGLPESWRGRRAVLMSDLHLGTVNGAGFARRMVRLAEGLKPDIVFIPGDLFDGTKADLDGLVSPFREMKARFGVYFSTGNHEEFAGTEHYLDAVARAGMRVLSNERVTVDGLHVAGVPFGDSTSPIRLQATLEGMGLDRNEASILLNHMPSRLPIVERAGVSLQVSGHTHGGQFAPFTWFTRRVFGRFTHGMQRFGELQVYTSTGAGTWGPPMRVGTAPEIVLLTFE